VFFILVFIERGLVEEWERVEEEEWVGVGEGLGLGIKTELQREPTVQLIRSRLREAPASSFTLNLWLNQGLKSRRLFFFLKGAILSCRNKPSFWFSNLLSNI